jgi:hypothetical protein
MKTPEVDQQSEGFLKLLAEQERIRSNKVAGVRTVLVVMSSKAMVYDRESLRQKILLTYPEAAVFFQNTLGTFMGPASPNKVDLIIDLTGPGQRQGLFAANRLKSKGRTVVGRNAGLFRKRLYHRLFDEKTASQLPTELFNRERMVQREVMALVGVALAPQGDLPPDRGKTIALELPPLLKV